MVPAWSSSRRNGQQDFVRRERITDKSLIEAIDRAEKGLIDADLGGGLIKQRVARVGQGRSGGYRLLVAYRTRGRAIFLFSFAKNETGNIDPDQLLTLRRLTDGALQEVGNDEETEPPERSHR